MIKKFVYLATVCLMASCSGTDLADLNEAPQTPGIKTKFESHKVSLNHIEKLMRSDSVMTRGEENITNYVECLSLDKSDTLLFAYNKPQGGWILYASDTRVPAIVAESSNGSFDDLVEVEPAKMWIEGMMEDMAAVREASDEMLNFTPEQIEANQSFWKALTAPDEFANQVIDENPEIYSVESETYGVKPGGGLLPVDWPGHYELDYTSSHTEVYDSIPRLTVTNWDQNANYNKYCPLTSDGKKNSDAGCGAIAVAQILYYMHYKIGKPLRAPSYAYCNSRNNEKPYDWDQTNPSTIIWNLMFDSERAAPLIAHIGNLVNMEYTDLGSSSIFTNLRNALIYYGLSCDYFSYNNNINKLKNSLLNERPVILGAANDDKIGHFFYADSYKRSRNVKVFVYKWVYDSTPPTDVLLKYHPAKVSYSYDSPDINMIGINWGWGSTYNQPEYNGWYSLTGDWIILGNFHLNRSMIILND